MPESIALPLPRLSLGITGHRIDNPASAANADAIGAALSGICDAAAAAVAADGGAMAPIRLNSLLALGADVLAVEQGLARGWDVVAPLPFGLALTVAINCHPATAADARALLGGGSTQTAALDQHAVRLRTLAAQVRRFELAEQDAHVAALWLAALDRPDDRRAQAMFAATASERAAAAGRVMIEQSDVLIAIWDGITPGALGGTRHSMAVALDLGVPVIRIDAANPADITLLLSPEAIECGGDPGSPDTIAAFLRGIVSPPGSDRNDSAIRFHTEQWHPASARRFHAYRRIEALFGRTGMARFASLSECYEMPENYATGSGKPLLDAARALPGGDASLVDRIGSDIMRRFAWADGLSTYLSDAYRGGMVMNFLLSVLAISAGVAYLPLASVDWKWPFALAELLLLLSIVAITATGRKRRWHGRWFETRRVAEYLRHAPILLLLGVARSSGRWPRGSDTQWPEQYARDTLRAIGVPHIVIGQIYLRNALDHVLGDYVVRQRDYHRAKADRLTTVHHRLDHLSERLFIFALASVALYLLLLTGGAMALVPESLAHDASKLFTFLGIVLPSLGGAFAGIRYFGDFERFAAISKVTAGKLDALATRIRSLLDSPCTDLRYAQVAALAHTMDDIVIAEIESWQAVFAGKNIAVPV
jgi:hypothetical protein